MFQAAVGVGKTCRAPTLHGSRRVASYKEQQRITCLNKVASFLPPVLCDCAYRRISGKGGVGSSEGGAQSADGGTPGLATTSSKELPTSGLLHDRPSSGAAAQHCHAGSAEKLWSACAAVVGCMGVAGLENGDAERPGRHGGPGDAAAHQSQAAAAAGEDVMAHDSRSQSVYTAAADGASAGNSFAGEAGNGVTPSGASDSVGSAHAPGHAHALALPAPPSTLGTRAEASVGAGSGASPTTPFPVLTSPFRLAAGCMPEGAAGSSAPVGGGGTGAGPWSAAGQQSHQLDLDTVSEQVLQGHSSIASFHTCLSLAESAALTTYLQHPALVRTGTVERAMLVA